MPDAVFARHRGPYKLFIVRRNKKLILSSEWLKGEVEGEEVEEEARSLLEDPRDTIIAVDVWSTRETQFVTGFKRKEEAA